jgi:hypothetical protein
MQTNQKPHAFAVDSPTAQGRQKFRPIDKILAFYFRGQQRAARQIRPMKARGTPAFGGADNGH